MTIRLITAFVIALLFVTAFGKFYIPWLVRQKAGQMIKTIGPNWHLHKQGTPTMGGVMFIFGCILVVLTVGFEGMLHGNWSHVFVLLFAVSFGGIGFLDDWEKLRHKENLGLTTRNKFILQLLVALLFIIIMNRSGYISDELYLPFSNTFAAVPKWLYFILSAFVIVGTVNAVNITDGVDGLATGTSLPVLLFFVAVTCIAGQEYLQLGIFASGLLGGLVGFLFFNFNPAKCFMGDTGSLFLGGAIAALAFAYDMPLILLTLGFVFIIETLSDIIQVTYFKLTHGKRVFKMAPFHHHLEMGGWTGKKWSEKELFCLFTGVSLLFAVISFIAVYHRYI